MLVIYELVKDDNNNVVDETNIFDCDKIDAITWFLKKKRDIIISDRQISKSMSRGVIIKDKFIVRYVKEI